MNIKVAIIGTGNIGTDLLMKAIKSEYMDVVAFVGRRTSSDGIRIANDMGIVTSTDGIDFFTDKPKFCDVVFDCTSANDAMAHAEVFRKLGIKVIDLTPSKVGDMCVPSINSDSILTDDNVNMITCGGQASIPMLHILSRYCTNLKYIEIVSQISSNSAGMATRINVDSYITTTRMAIQKFTGCDNCKVILNLNPAIPCVDMQTTIFMEADSIDIESANDEILKKISELKTYIPYYDLILHPHMDTSGVITMSIRVTGSGDYLPAYAGNLDIINCAAIKLAERLT